MEEKEKKESSRRILCSPYCVVEYQQDWYAMAIFGYDAAHWSIDMKLTDDITPVQWKRARKCVLGGVIIGPLLMGLFATIAALEGSGAARNLAGDLVMGVVLGLCIGVAGGLCAFAITEWRRQPHQLQD